MLHMLDERCVSLHVPPIIEIVGWLSDDRMIAYTSSEGSGEPAHPRSLARTSAARSYKQ